MDVYENLLSDILSHNKTVKCLSRKGLSEQVSSHLEQQNYFEERSNLFIALTAPENKIRL